MTTDFTKDRKIYFGTQNLMSWVPAPGRDVDRSSAGWSSVSDRLNGTKGVKRSAGTSRSYGMSWGLARDEEIDIIFAYANGDYGTDGIYWVDPWAAATNIMPDCWASPWKAGLDGKNLAGKDATRPAVYDTPDNTKALPVKYANYYLNGTETFREVWIPIPEGFYLHFGFHGNLTDGTAGFEYQADDDEDPTEIVLIDTETDGITNSGIAGPNGVTFRMFGEVDGDLDFYGAVACLSKNQYSSGLTQWHTGQGHDALFFTQMPTDRGIISNGINSFRAVECTLVEAE